MKVQRSESIDPEYINNDFFIPFCNLYLDESLKDLKPSEFKTYITIIYVIKSIGPNTRIYFSNKISLYENIIKLSSVSKKTFLKHLKKLHNRGLIEISGKKIDIGFNIEDSKYGGFTPINKSLLTQLIKELDNNELKLYLTIYRLTKGFNKKSARLTYSQLKKWSGIKNKSIFIETRKSLNDKRFINSLHDLKSNTYQYRLEKITNPISSRKENKKLRQVEKEHSKPRENVEKKLHINKYIPNKNKYYKKSIKLEKSEKSYTEKNKEKIFKFMSLNIKTKNLSKKDKEELFNALILDITKNGCLSGLPVKTTPDFYLSRENAEYGRVFDKIVERYFGSIKVDKANNEAREIYFEAFKKYFPEKVYKLGDFKTNDLTRRKLDILIQKAPSIGYWSDTYIFTENTQVKEDSSEEYTGQSEIISRLIEKRLGHTNISLEERLILLNKITEELDIKTESMMYYSEKTKMSFEDFSESYT